MRDALAAVVGSCSRAAASGWLLIQQAVAATVAWVLASYVIDHREPFFAPMAALVALNAPLGERGGNAVRLAQGVLIGIVAGEIGLGILGTSSASLFLATLVAIAASRALGGTPLVLAQAGSAAILTIATGDSDVGPGRLIDALIGGGIALLFSQVLFTPEPTRLLRRSESRVLLVIADGFDLAATAIERDDRELAAQAIDSLREVSPRLVELGRTRRAGPLMARRSAVWRTQMAPVVEESEKAGQLDLLGGSALMVVRYATAATGGERLILAPAIRELADDVRDLAEDPGDRAVRQRVVDRLLERARRLRSERDVREAAPDSTLTATVFAMNATAADVMVFAGVDPDDAAAAILRIGESLPSVSTPAAAVGAPFDRARRLWEGITSAGAKAVGAPSRWIRRRRWRAH
ncbi:FUSC family protein [Kribbella sp. CA-247076]|uniref:FUSC family protein n=1 Tax=Kribbella sp. CA-247076 TaxID=3239941 RepID=UPI003D92B28D